MCGQSGPVGGIPRAIPPEPRKSWIGLELINLTLAALKAALSVRNPDGSPLPSAIAQLRLYLRRGHREWWSLVHGVGRKPAHLPQFSHTEAEREGGQAATLEPLASSWAVWTRDRWMVPEVYTPNPSQRLDHALGVVEDEDTAARRRRPTARMMAETHHRRYADCAACEARAGTILGGCELTFPNVPPSAPDPDAKRWSADAAHRARARRIGKMRRPADKGNELSPVEWSRYWSLRHKASLCCSATAVLQRHLPAAGEHIERMAVPLRCRTRECAPCAQVIADHAKVRMEAPWRQLVTLTLRQDATSEAHTWRHVSRWVSKLMTKLHKIARRGTKVCKCFERRHDHEHSNIIADGEPFKYAWVIEPHKKGWPHVHIAWTPRYVCYGLLRELWWEVTGIEGSGTWTEKLKDVWKIPYYLSKYLSKGRFSTRLLALMWRRRLWASNVKRPERVDLGYKLIEIQKGSRAQLSLDTSQPPLVRDESGWVAESHRWWFVEGKSGNWNKWEITSADADSASIGLREEVWRVAEEDQEWEWDRSRRVAKLTLDAGYGHVLGVKKKYLDIETIIVRAWRKGFTYDADGKPISYVGECVNGTADTRGALRPRKEDGRGAD